jgi:hypothetical protein
MLRIFSPERIRRIRPGANPRSWVLEVGLEAYRYSFLISGLEKGAWSTLIPVHITPKKEHCYSSNSNPGGLTESVWMVVEDRNIYFPDWGSNRQPSNLQRVAIPIALSIHFNSLIPSMLRFSYCSLSIAFATNVCDIFWFSSGDSIAAMKNVPPWYCSIPVPPAIKQV